MQQDLDLKQLNAVIEALEKLYPRELGIGDYYQPGQTTVSWAIPDTNINYQSTTSKSELLSFAETAAGIKKYEQPTIADPSTIKRTYQILFEKREKLQDSQQVEAPEQIDKNFLNKEELAALEEQAKQREEEIEKTKKSARDKTLQDELQRQTENEKQQIRLRINKIRAAEDQLKNQEIYVKVELPEQKVLSDEDNKSLEILHEAAKNNRKELVDDFTEKVEEKISKELPELTKEEIRLIARMHSAEIVERLANSQTANVVGYTDDMTQLAILDKLASSSTQIGNIKDKNTQEAVTESARVAYSQKSQTILTRDIAELVLGENLAEKLFGVDPTKIKVNLVSTKEEGSVVIKPNELARTSLRVEEDRLSFAENIRDFSGGEVRSFVFKKAAEAVEKKIAELPAGSTIKSVYESPVVKSILSRYGLARPPMFRATSKMGATILKYYPEGAPYINLFGQVIGKDVGIAFVSYKAVSAALVKSTVATAMSVAETGGIYASEAFLGGAAVATAQATAAKATGGAIGKIISAIASAIGVTSSTVTFGVSLAASAIVSEVAKRIDWSKVKKFFEEWVVPGFLVIGGITIGAPVLGLAGGGIAFGMARGLTLAGMGGGVVNAIRTAFSFVVLEIGTAAIVIILSIPPLVALIMLVINNSAYVVPPSLNLGGSGTQSPYIDVKKVAEPAGPFENSEVPKTIKYTITITAKKGNLTNIEIKDLCQVISRTVSDCPTHSLPSAPETISPSSPFTFSYTMLFDSRYTDSTTINTVTVNASVEGRTSASASTSASVTIGNPPISCPVIGGHVASPLLNYSYNPVDDTGHGSKKYWNAMGTFYSYSIPQSTSCKHPGDCSYYGYAYDVFPQSSTDVFAPTVLGKDTTWDCSYAFPNGGGSVGHTYHCISSDGNYMLVLTHMTNGAKTGTIKSGEKIGTLYNQSDNTHLHIEFQVNGQYVKPEEYFCGGM